MLHLLDELHSSVGDQVRQVVPVSHSQQQTNTPTCPPVIVVPVVLHVSVVVEGVVVVPGVPHQPQPPTPAGRDVAAVVLVEILAQVGRQVAAGLQGRGEGRPLVALLPAEGAAVLVVGEDMMVVHVQTWTRGQFTCQSRGCTCQHGGSGGATHRSAHVAIPVGGSLGGQVLVQARHEVQ